MGRGHSGVAGSEGADGVAGQTGWVAAWIPKREVATPVGIRQAFFGGEAVNHYSYSVYLDYDERPHLQVGYPSPG